MTAPQVKQHHRHLAEANLLIVQIRARIERQRKLLAMLDADGNKARKAKDSLDRLVNTLQGMLQGRALILEELNRPAICFFDQPEWLRRRANEARAIGAGLNSREAKQLRHRLAKSYERLRDQHANQPPRSD